jgi:DNA-binding NtrC family response regulator
VWVLGSEGVNVGSHTKNDVVLDDRYVSSFHAQIFVQEGRCFIRDLDSRNGVFIADQKVREAQVPVGSLVRVGQSVLLVATEDGGVTADHEPARPGTTLIGISPAMDKLRALLRRVAQHGAPVLITGETGTGKEVVAQSLVELSPRAHRSYVTLNCGALGRNLIESELFGHEKGAFTGAVARKAGAFELADRGTLFLDEIGELPVDLQPQLLRVVEYHEVRRVGGEGTFRVDVRLIAATNRHLEAEVAAGTFREDLYHRLHVLRIQLPPLRDRREDIPVLTRHFIDQACPEGTSIEITPEALDVLTGHPWPGNVRELRNVMQRAVLMRDADRIDVADITFTPSTLAHRVEAASAKSGRTLAEIEREAIIAELGRHRGNKKEAAAALGVSRSTIHRKIDEYSIEVGKLS